MGKYFHPGWFKILLPLRFLIGGYFKPIKKRETFQALRADASIYSRPIINKQNNNGSTVESPYEIGSQFDSIAYAKGGNIHKMVQHVIDERRWQAGMREYIQANLYGNTDGRIYFSHMQHAINTVPPYQVCF